METLSDIKKDALRDLKAVSCKKELEEFEIKYFGRKHGRLTRVLRSLGSLSGSKRAKIGKGANKLRAELEEKIRIKKAEFQESEMSKKLEKERIDVTFPGRSIPGGHIHLLTKVRQESEEIFTSLGFDIIEGPGIESDYYNFTALNIPPEHPARDMWDTFWISEGSHALRPHTSSVQVRYMEKHSPPFRVIAPGPAFRREATDFSHEIDFYQLECLAVDREISVANLKSILLTYFRRLFNKEVNVRLRPSYFPFVEPGFEVDMSCVSCGGKGCRVCKQTGWMELLGAGMVHPNVFKYAGYAKGEWQGLAFGMGLERIAMMKYKIPDMRLFRSGDLRFLEQF